MDDFIHAEPVESTTVQGAQKHAQNLLSTDKNARTEAAAPGMHTLKVENGRGSGRHAAGTMVTVTADAPPAGQQFAGGTGDVQILANPAVPTTRVTMPSMEVTITATYRELPR